MCESGGELAVAGADLVAGPADPRVRSGAFDSLLQFAHVLLGLVDIPALGGVVPDLFEIGLGGW
jgi:hypothetical protein